MQRHLATQPQFGYLPKRSSQQALSRIFHHCNEVREACTSQERSIYAKKRGAPSGQCEGGACISIDLTQAFDRACRHILESSLELLGVPADLRQALMQWVHSTRYIVKRQEAENSFESGRGFKQGCRLSPTLCPSLSLER